jgi:hypothetical protein
MTPEETAAEYLKMQGRVLHPYGQRDGAGRWYPVEKERASCCGNVRQPTRAYPWTLMTHCRTLKHVCTLHGQDIKKVRFLISDKGLPLLMGLNDPWINRYITEKFKGA